MQLNELTSVKKYKDKTFYDVMSDFGKAGGNISNGKYGTVLSHPKWNYVFKTFPDDPHYLRFVRWAKKNQQLSALPRILGGPWRMVPFYARPAKGPSKVYVIKLELLSPITDTDLQDCIMRWVDNGQHYGVASSNAQVLDGVEEYKHARQELIDAKALSRSDPTRGPRVADALLKLDASQIWKTHYELSIAVERYPSLEPLCQAYGAFLDANLEGSPDLHKGNFMQRSDGSLVMIDPLWAGETPYQAHARMLQAEYMDDDEPEPDNEYNTIPGGKLRAKKRPKTISRTEIVSDVDDDFPF